MNRFRLVIPSILLFALVAVLAAQARRGAGTDTIGAAAPTRLFEFTYQVHVPANADSHGPTHLWIPLPQADAYQEVRSLHIDSPVWHSQGPEAEYGNKFVEFKPTAEQSAAGFHVTLTFTPVSPHHNIPLHPPTPQNSSSP